MKHTYKSTTHWCCNEILERGGGYASCCGCMDHDCKPVKEIKEVFNDEEES